MTAATSPKPRRTPKYRRHKATGQGYVELNGKRQYLGAFDRPDSREKYHRLIAEWEASGRQLRVAPEGVTIVEVIDHFWQHAKSIYLKPNGSPTSELESYRQILRPLKQLYASTRAADFGPRAFKAVRQKMVESGWARTHINKQTSRLKSVFRWATEEELIPANIYHALQAVRGLAWGRTEARETAPVKPVPEELIGPIKPFVSDQVWTMIQIQLLTGCRPDEAVRLRSVDFSNTRGDVWIVHYDQHKTARFGIRKAIFFGPQARLQVAPYLESRPLNAYLFSPTEAEEVRRRRLHVQRRTPLSCGNTPGSNRNAHPSRHPEYHYTVDSYRRAIERGCDLAFPLPHALQRQKVPGRKGQRWEKASEWKARLGQEAWMEVEVWLQEHRWSPNRLRHNAATHLRQEFGIEVAQTVLGHQLGSRITELYAEQNVSKAVDAIRKVG